MPRNGMMLGKLAPKFNRKTLAFSKYLLPSAPPPPPSKAYYEYKIPASAWGMLGNDQYGCCTCAGPGHEIMNRTAHSGTMAKITTDDVLAMYAAICPGFNPVTDANDNGAAITDALNYLLTTGLAGHKIDGWAAIDNTNIVSIKQGVYLFGSVNIGVNLPNSAMDQTQAGQPWDVVANDGGIDGGHCIPIMGYGAAGCTCITWGALQQMSWEWFAKYCDEAYAEISSDWLDAQGVAPNSLNMATLQADLNALKA
jgi:hypothetical protein